MGDLADKGLQVAGEWHPASPGASDGKMLEERKEFDGMGAVGFDAGLVGSFGGVELPIAADDDLAVAGLATIEVTGEPLALQVGEFERGLLVSVGMVVPVVVRFERADAVKYTGWHGSRRPHLAAHSKDGDMETEHSTKGATPWTGG